VNLVDLMEAARHAATSALLLPQFGLEALLSQLKSLHRV